MNIFKKLQRKTALCLSILLTAVTFPVVCTVQAVTTATEISESFNEFDTTAVFNSGNTTYNLWAANANSNSWSVTNDVYGRAIKIGGQTSSTMLYNKEFTGNNVIYSAKVKATSSATVGLTARYRDSSNFYFLTLSNNGTMSIGKRVSGTNSTLRSAVMSGFDAAKYYTMTFVVQGNKLTGSIAGGPTVVVADDSISETPPTTHKIGFYAVANASGFFDDVYATNVLPPAPTNMHTISETDNQITLGWAGSSTQYVVKRSSVAGGPYTPIATVTDAVYTDSVPNGTIYKYVVAAVDPRSDGQLQEGQHSTELSAMPSASTQSPLPPTGMFVTVGSNQVVLNWSSATSTTSYKVKRGSQQGGPYSTIATLGPGASMYTDEGLQNGQTYYYIVTASNSSGESSASNEMSATPSLPPGSPAGLGAVPGNAQVLLAWNASPGAIHYTVKRGTSVNGPFSPIVSNLTRTDYIDASGLVNGTVYYYVVQAVNASGVSSANSNTSQAMPQMIYSYDAKNITASSHDGNVPQNVADEKYSTRWGSAGVGQWLQVDMGAVSSVGYVGVSFYKGDTRSSYFDVAASVDGATWNVVYHGSSSGTSSLMQLFDIPDTQVRYIRIIGQGNTANDYNGIQELQIYAPNPNGLIAVPIPEETAVSAPQATAFTVPGLYNADGTPHVMPSPNQVTGRTINVVTEFGADPADNTTDDRPAIQNALDAAVAGDELYFPNGVYNLKTAAPGDSNSHFILKSGVNLRGENQEGTVFLSDFDNLQGGPTASSSRILLASNRQNIVISHLTLSSSWNGAWPTDPAISNPNRGGPKNGIYIDDTTAGALNSPTEPQNILIEYVTVEKFEKMGIRISKAHDITVRNSILRNTSDIGGGGAGYGISIQGVFKENRLGYYNDARWNVIENNTFDGTNAMRHGALLQGYAHNNVVRNNQFLYTTYDSIDLHGEDEYMNEIYGNTIIGTKRGAGVGIGNTGGSAPSNHDASGPFNYIHDNTIRNAMRGLQIYMGSPDTIVENNLLESSPELEATRPFPTEDGIQILNAPRTIVRGNMIRGFSGPASHGIWLAQDQGDAGAGFVGAGDPKDVILIGNTITENMYGVTEDAGAGAVLQQNTITGNILSDVAKAPGVVSFNVVKTPSKDALAVKDMPNTNFGTGATATSQTFRMTTDATGSQAAIAYFTFDVDSVSLVTYAGLQLSGRVTDLNPGADAYTLDIYGLNDDSWDESELTWNYSLGHGELLPYVTGNSTDVTKLGTITITGNVVQSYNMTTAELTSFIKSRANGRATFMVLDTNGRNGNVELYARENSFETIQPKLKLVYSEQAEYKRLVLLNSDGHEVTELVPSAEVTASIQLKNYSPVPASGVIIAALYRPDGSMELMKEANSQLAGYESGEWKVEISLPDQIKDYKLKLFVWDSLTGLQPLTDYVTIR
ncbi:discoidin domain-containing protein [Paenibacillus ferrarius]|uniref:discoidin domain-containing protein n=1 Tax=Paenibacillus ferrarius TaxID=1469647 RepID=UPI003D2CD883